MANKIGTLKNSDGDNVYPITLESCVYDKNNKSLDKKLEEMSADSNNKLNNLSNSINTKLEAIDTVVNEQDGKISTKISNLEAVINQKETTLNGQIQSVGEKLERDVIELSAVVDEKELNLGGRIDELNSSTNEDIENIEKNINSLSDSINEDIENIEKNINNLSDSINQKETSLTDKINQCVKKTGDETIAGIKTFSSAPKTSETLDPSLNDTTLATTAWVKEDTVLWTGSLNNSSEIKEVELEQAITNFRYIAFTLVDNDNSEKKCVLVNVADQRMNGYNSDWPWLLDMHNPNDYQYITITFTSTKKVKVIGGNDACRIWHIRGLK